MDFERLQGDQLLHRMREGLRRSAPTGAEVIAVEWGLLTIEQVHAVAREIETSSPAVSLREALIDRGMITPDAYTSLLKEVRRRQLNEVLDRNAETPPAVLQPMLDDPARNMGRYVLVERVGQGGAAEVWRAWDAQVRRWVALKLFRSLAPTSQLVQRFTREAEIVGRLRHPNIVRLHDSGVWNDHLFLVLDWMAGGDLHQWIGERKPSEIEIVAVMEKVARTVHAAHRAGVLHRDLKPSNVLMDDQGEPVLGDFGLAVSWLDPARITLPNTMIGTPAYIAPELLRAGSGQSTVQSDVYSLGISLYELLTGTLPFQAASVSGMIAQVLAVKTPLPPSSRKPSIGKDLEEVCLRAMAFEPGDRYRTALEMATDLRNVLAGEPVRARRSAPARKVLRWVRRSGVPGWMAGIVAISVLIVWLAGKSRGEAEAERQFRVATEAYRARNYPTARAAAENAYSLDPTLIGTQYLIGRSYLAEIEDRLGPPAPWRILADIYFFPRSPETSAQLLARSRAREYLRRCQIGPGNGQDGFEREAAGGLIDYLDGNMEGARNHLHGALTVRADPELSYFHAMALYGTRRFGEAAGALEAVAGIREERYERARVLMAIGRAVWAELDGSPDVEDLTRQAEQICTSAALDRLSRIHFMAVLACSRIQRNMDEGEITGETLKEIDGVLAGLKADPDPPVEIQFDLALALMLRAQVGYFHSSLEEGKGDFGAAQEAFDKLGDVADLPSIGALLKAYLTVWYASNGVAAFGLYSEATVLARHARKILEEMEPGIRRTPDASLVDAMTAIFETTDETVVREAVEAIRTLKATHPSHVRVLQIHAGVCMVASRCRPMARWAYESARESVHEILKVNPRHRFASALQARSLVGIAMCDLQAQPPRDLDVAVVERALDHLQDVLPRSAAARISRADYLHIRSRQVAREGGNPVPMALEGLRVLGEPRSDWGAFSRVERMDAFIAGSYLCQILALASGEDPGRMEAYIAKAEDMLQGAIEACPQNIAVRGLQVELGLGRVRRKWFSSPALAHQRLASMRSNCTALLQKNDHPQVRALRLMIACETRALLSESGSALSSDQLEEAREDFKILVESKIDEVRVGQAIEMARRLLE